MTVRPFLIIGLLTLAFTATSTGAVHPVRKAIPKAQILSQQTQAPSGRVVVKFRESSRIQIVPGRAVSPDKAANDRIATLFASAAPGGIVDRRFRADRSALDQLRETGEARTGLSLPDLNTYAVLEPGLPRDDRAGLLEIVVRLLADPAVETAFLEPLYAPAILGFDAFTGTYTPPEFAEDPLPHYANPDAGDSTDFSSLQTYLGAPPEGLNVLAAADIPGGCGDGVKVVDVEMAWLWDHEDLTDPFYMSGTMYDNLDWRNHGTAVAGIIRGLDDESGIRGIAPDCLLGAASIIDQSLPEAILDAADKISLGDVILIELHAPGPNSTGIGEFGYMPVEFWQDNFDAILLASASGRIVCEAGGNGQQDLDGPEYHGLFDPDYRDSGAIFCGAARPDLTPEWFTNHGQRFNLHAWGRDVTTSGYGDLQGSGEGYAEEQWYTDIFSGTSSASAIIAGAVADLQGMARAEMGFSLDPSVVREVLAATGTPYLPSAKHIGPRPDLIAAWQLANASVGNLKGRVSNVDTDLPIRNVEIRIPGLDRTVLTDHDGLYNLNLPGGPMSLQLDEYLYAQEMIYVQVTPGVGKTQDIQLTKLPQITLSGHVAGMDTLMLRDIRIWVPNKPVLPVYSREDGAYDLPGLALGKSVTVLYDYRPWHGAHAQVITPIDDPAGFNVYQLRIAPANEDFFTNGGYQSFGAHWQWGIPGNGPEEAFSPERCWAVGLYDNYLNNAQSYLTSATYFFPETDLLQLSFHYWCELESSYDGVNLELLIDGNWTLVEPLTGYTHASVAALGTQPGWSGMIGEWRGAVFDFSDLNSGTTRFRFHFRSDEALRQSGFFIDDVTFTVDRHTVGVEMTPQPGSSARAELNAYPNPFNPRTRIAWRAAQPGPIALSIYDTRGRLVRTLHERDNQALDGVVTWHGVDDAGRTQPSGVYMVRMRDAGGATAVRRVTLMK